MQQGSPLFNHLSGAGEYRRRDVDAKRLGRLEIDQQLELRLLCEGLHLTYPRAQTCSRKVVDGARDGLRPVDQSGRPARRGRSCTVGVRQNVPQHEIAAR